MPNLPIDLTTLPPATAAAVRAILDNTPRTTLRNVHVRAEYDRLMSQDGRIDGKYIPQDEAQDLRNVPSSKVRFKLFARKPAQVFTLRADIVAPQGSGTKKGTKV